MLKRVDRTLHSTATPVQDMGVDHGCRNTPVTEEFLHRAYVVAILEKMGRENCGAYSACGIGATPLPVLFSTFVEGAVPITIILNWKPPSK